MIGIPSYDVLLKRKLIKINHGNFVYTNFNYLVFSTGIESYKYFPSQLLLKIRL